MGLLPQVAGDVHVSISTAGLLVTGYSLGVAIGAPVITVVTFRMPRKNVLIGLMSIFILGHVLSVLSADFSVLMVSRVIASFSHGSFLGIASVVATNLVPEQKKAAAVSLLLSGASIANIVGVPFGTYIGQEYGWRVCFAIIAVLGLIGTICIALFVPAMNSNSGGQIKQEFLVLKKPQVLLALLITIFSFGGVFTTFTYIAPILKQLAGFPDYMVTWLMLIFGVGVVIGNTLGGKMADWRLYTSMVVITVVLSLVFVLLSFITVKWMMSVLVLMLGVTSFAILPSLQVNILCHAQEAPQLASSINVSIVHIGNACGAALGGWVIESSWGLSAVPLVSALISLVGIILIFLSAYLNKQTPLT